MEYITYNGKKIKKEVIDDNYKFSSEYLTVVTTDRYLDTEEVDTFLKILSSEEERQQFIRFLYIEQKADIPYLQVLKILLNLDINIVIKLNKLLRELLNTNLFEKLVMNGERGDEYFIILNLKKEHVKTPVRVSFHISEIELLKDNILFYELILDSLYKYSAVSNLKDYKE